MVFYKFRHKPSGLFFKPRRFRYGKGPVPTLSKKGKVYITPPSFKWIEGCGPFADSKNGILAPTFVPEDWEIVIYRVEG